MSDTRTKTWIQVDEAIKILNAYDYLKVTILKLSKLDENPVENGNNYFYAAKIYSVCGSTLEFYRCFGKATVKKNIFSVKQINDNTYRFVMENKTSYLIEGITDTNINHTTGDVKAPETLIDWNKSYIDEQNNIIIVLAICECFDYPFYQRVYQYMQQYLNGFKSRLINRSIYYKITPENKILHGIFNLENNMLVTEVNFRSFYWFDFDTWIDEKYILQLAEIYKKRKILKNN